MTNPTAYTSGKPSNGVNWEEKYAELFGQIKWLESYAEFGIKVGERIYWVKGYVDIATDPLPEGAHFIGREVIPLEWQRAPEVQFGRYCEKPHQSIEEEERCDRKTDVEPEAGC